MSNSSMPGGAVPSSLRRLADRYDPRVFELARSHARIRLAGASPEPIDAVLDGHTVKLQAADGERPDAILSADEHTWDQIADDLRGGMEAFRSRRLKIRYDLHLGVGFLAATADSGPGGLRFAQVKTSMGSISISEAGAGPPVVMLHGLGATKVSFLPTVAALARSHRAIAIDLPGFGDSDKPIRAAYDAPYFARAVVALLDALNLERAHIVGNSMGGRVAIEVGLSAPQRVGRLGLLAPSLAWLKNRPWAPLLKLFAPQLGLIQPVPRGALEALVRRAIPAAGEEWTAAGIDEFLRSFLTPRGRAAFYAAARNIYLEEPRGPGGLWTRLPQLEPQSLFVWGKRDRIVPIAFAAHVRKEVPRAAHLELDCGHVPQLERPYQTHEALLRFFASAARRHSN